MCKVKVKAPINKSLWAVASMLVLFGCKSIPDRPSFEPSTAFDGSYSGERIDKSNHQMCLETTIVGTVVGGEANFTLTYNNTVLKGWIKPTGELTLHGDNTSWSYDFKGMATQDEITGEWWVGNAPCHGTWSVQREK